MHISKILKMFQGCEVVSSQPDETTENVVEVTKIDDDNESLLSGTVDAEVEISDETEFIINTDNEVDLTKGESEDPTSNNNSDDVNIERPTLCTDEQYEVLVNLIKSINRNEEATVLEQDQVCILLEHLMNFNENYFPSIPMTDELSKSFIWNIPYNTFKATCNAADCGKPDILNPMLLFYIFFVKDDGTAYPKFLQIIRHLLNKYADVIDEGALEYDRQCVDDFQEEEGYNQEEDDENTDDEEVEKVESELVEEDDIESVISNVTLSDVPPGEINAEVFNPTANNVKLEYINFSKNKEE